MNVLCPKCKKEFEQPEKGFKNKFCSRTCANSHNQTKEQNNARRKKLAKIRQEKCCITCGKKLGINNKSGYCNICVRVTSEYREALSKAVKGKAGGLREGSGRGKKGWYKGYFCDSTWELAFLVYCIDNNIKIIRNTKGFKYSFNRKLHKFYPDFLLENNTFIEIKGQQDAQYRAKQKSFPYKLITIGKDEIKYYIEYVNKNYTTNLISLYDLYRPQYMHICLFCEKGFENDKEKATFCSRSCAGKYRAIRNHSRRNKEF